MHEHQRPDRDDYIQIHYENIDSEWVINTKQNIIDFLHLNKAKK